MTTNRVNPYQEERKQSAVKLRRLEALERLLEFDMNSLQMYADSVAEDRQRLTQLVSTNLQAH